MDLPVSYSAKQVELVMEAAKVLISLATGFLVVAAGSSRYFLEQGLLRPVRARTLLGATFVAGIASVAAWSAAIAATVDAALAFNLPSRLSLTDVQIARNVCRVEGSYGMAVRFEQIALILFFIAVGLYLLLVFDLFKSGAAPAADNKETLVSPQVK